MSGIRPVRSAGIVMKEGLASDICLRVVRKLISEGIDAYTIGPLRADGATSLEGVEELKQIKPDVVVSLGGDGTLLRTLRALDDETPVLAVNIGHRGILCEIKPEEICGAVERLKRGEYKLDRRMRLIAENTELPPATNEIYMVRRRHIGTPIFTIKIEKTSLHIRMDGVAISTPTGSTGHAHSLGGPVLHEKLEGIVIVPSSPIQKMPPIVMPLQPLTLSANQHTDLVADGQELQSIEAGVEVKISRYKYDAVLVRFNDYTLRQLRKMLT